jgi:hypothetical protein
VLFGFVVFAQHLALRVHFDANLLAFLIDNGFKVGALFLPADNGSAFGFGLRSLLNSSRHIRAADSLLFVFSFFRLCGHTKHKSGTDRRYCEQVFCFHIC